VPKLSVGADKDVVAPAVVLAGEARREQHRHRQRLGVVGLRTKEFDAAELNIGADEGTAAPAAGKTGEFGEGAELTDVGSSTSLIRSSDRRGRTGGRRNRTGSRWRRRKG
jgi:hypothetical protein